MNRDFKYVDGKIVVTDYDGNIRKLDYCANIEEILKLENAIEILNDIYTQTVNKTENLEKNNNCSMLAEVVGDVGVPLLSLVPIYIAFNKYELSLGQSIAMISSILMIDLISLGLSEGVFSHMRKDRRANYNVENHIKILLEQEKKKLDEILTNSKIPLEQNDDKNRISLNDYNANIMKHYKRIKDIYYDLGYNEKKYLRYLKNDFLDDMLFQKGYNFDERELMQKSLEEKVKIKSKSRQINR